MLLYKIIPSYTKMLEVRDLDHIHFDVAQKQQRAHEDRYQVKAIGPFRYFAIFDGHAGSHLMNSEHVADVCVNQLHNMLAVNSLTIDLPILYGR